MIPVEYKKMAYEYVLKTAVTKSKRVITPSAAVADDLVRKYSIKPDKITVTYEGVDDHIIRNIPQDTGVLKTRLEEFRINSDYFLYVGSAYEHKNLNLLVVAFNELLKTQNLRLQLVFAGGKDRFVERLAAFTHALGLDGKVIYPTKYTESKYLSDKDLAYLYKGAMAYVFPSLSEGFSITPLEAQAIGVPVLLSDIPVHREIFGDSVLYFNSKSNIDLTEKMQQMYKNKDFREALIDKGFENANKYSWKRMASQTLDVYRKIINNQA